MITSYEFNVGVTTIKVESLRQLWLILAFALTTVMSHEPVPGQSPGPGSARCLQTQLFRCFELNCFRPLET